MDELTLLKQKADTLGVKYHPSIGIEALREKINAKMAEGESVPGVDGPVLSQAEAEQLLRKKLIQDQMKLVRIRVTNLDPKKKDLQGEVITVGNRFLGTVRKFIPFGEATDNGYHVPFIVYTELKNRRFSQVKTRKGPNGQLFPETKLVPEYAIEVLPPLTRKELDDLKAQQAAAGGL